MRLFVADLFHNATFHPGTKGRDLWGRNYADWLIPCHRFLLPAWLSAAALIKMANLDVVRKAMLTLADQVRGVAWAAQNSEGRKISE